MTQGTMVKQNIFYLIEVKNLFSKCFLSSVYKLALLHNLITLPTK